MKKYIKPELFFEQYELSRHISNCGWRLNSPDEQSCVAKHDPEDWGYTTDTLFTTALSCTLNTDAGAVEDYCYQNGTGEITGLFNS